MAEVSAVAFDLDGTLLDHRTASRRAFAHLVGERGGAVTPDLERSWWDAEDRHFDAWRRGIITFEEQRRRRVREVLPLIGPGAVSDSGSWGGGLPGGTGDALSDDELSDDEVSDDELDRIFGVYLNAYEAAWCVFPEVVGVLDALRSAGLAVGLLTNGAERQQEKKLALTGIRDRFDVVCTSETLGVAKPDPRAFAALCSRLRVPAGGVLFVGDDYRMDILGASAAGLATYFVDRGGDGAGVDGGDGAAHPDLLGLLPLLTCRPPSGRPCPA